MLLNVTRDQVLARHVRYANTFRTRLVGLLGRRSLGADEALVIVPCHSVHTFFMRFAIDVAFLDRDGKLLHLEHNLRPYRWSPVVAGAHCAVEFPAHRLRETNSREGDLLVIADEVQACIHRPFSIDTTC